MAQYGQSKEDFPSTPGKPVSSSKIYAKPSGLAISAAAGFASGWIAFYSLPLLGAIIGLIASPLVLNSSAKQGEQFHTNKKGETLKIGVWGRWLGTGFVSISIMFAASISIGRAIPDKPPTQAELEAEKARTAAQNEQGLRKGLTDRCREELISTLKAPDSFQEKDSVIGKDGETYIASIKYTATNSFGARLLDHHICRYVKNN